MCFYDHTNFLVFHSEKPWHWHPPLSQPNRRRTRTAAHLQLCFAHANRTQSFPCWLFLTSQLRVPKGCACKCSCLVYAGVCLPVFECVWKLANGWRDFLCHANTERSSVDVCLTAQGNGHNAHTCLRYVAINKLNVNVKWVCCNLKDNVLIQRNGQKINYSS